VGIVGITLGGGMGWLSRKHGLTIDHVVAAEVVLADGSIVTASETEHPELFWAIRGGGGNFGVVTRFQYRLVPVDMVVGGGMFLPATPEVLAGLVPAAKAAPDELSMIAYMIPMPPLPFIPAERVGEMAVLVTLVYAGDLEAGMAAVAPFRALGEPIVDMVGPMPYPAMYQLLAEGGGRGSSVSRSFFADEIDDASVATILEHMTNRSSPMAMTQIRVLGGEVARKPRGSTAYAHRDRDVVVTLVAMFEGPSEPHDAWIDRYFQALRPIANGVYVNFLSDEPDRIAEAYPGPTRARLAEAKRRYDPTNLFHLNQNIRPD
jgi:FAD/FMN-containing dehydrogenase